MIKSIMKNKTSLPELGDFPKLHKEPQI